MNRRKFILSSAALIGSAPFIGGGRSDAVQSIDLDQLIESTRTPGLCAKGSVDGKKFLYTAGIREAGNAAPVTSVTYFSAASLTKPVFAMEVRRLVRMGKLEWNRPLQDYLPLGLTGDAAAITPAHVLTHGTGLPNWRFDPKEELACEFKPGSGWQYSGEGYVLLQRVVEHIAGEPLGAYLNGNLLPRLGMLKSTFTWRPDLEPQSAVGHDSAGRPLERSAVYYEKNAHAVAQAVGSRTDNLTYDQMIEAAAKGNALAMPVAVVPNAAGSLWTTIDDYCVFLLKTISDYRSHPEEYVARNRINRTISWTLSWGIDTSLKHPGYFHWGDGPGFKNFAWWEPKRETVVVIFSNGEHGASAYRVLLRRLLGADPIAPEWI